MSKSAASSWSLLGWCALTVGAGLLGSLASGSGITDWYPSLRKPSWTPPNGVFGPVWTLLYVLMGIAAWRVQRRQGWDRSLGLFLVQLGLNAVWSWLFFGLRRPDLALVDLALLWGAILGTVALFFKRDRAAGALLLPYLAWVSFAAALNAAIWQLNRG